MSGGLGGRASARFARFESRKTDIASVDGLSKAMLDQRGFFDKRVIIAIAYNNHHDTGGPKLLHACV